MASKGCAACFRALQKQPQALRKASQASLPRRSFTTTTPARFSVRGANAAAASSAPPAPATAPAVPTITKKEKAQASAHVTAGGLGALRKAAGTYTAYGVMEKLYRQCALQADYSIPQAAIEDEEMPKTADGEDLGIGGGWWHKDLGLSPTFSTWSQVTMLHMYLLTVRLRCFDAASAQIWQQHLIDHFFFDAENRMTDTHNMVARGARNKYLKDMFVQWRGLLFAYDEGLVRGDAALAGAVWRNVWKGAEDVDVRGVAMVVAHMRQSLAALEEVDDVDMQMGKWAFGEPEKMAGLVARRSRLMDKPFEREFLEAGEAGAKSA